MGLNDIDYRAEYEREHREYREAVARLTPAQRADWAVVEASYEWFDGESGIAHGTLNRMLRDGTLRQRAKAARATGWYG